MNYNPDDARLTAHALGELPPHEAQEVEALMASSPEARQEVEEIRGFAELLTEVFQREVVAKPAPDIDAMGGELPSSSTLSALEVRSPDEAHLEGASVVPMPDSRSRWPVWAGLGLAAGLCFLAGIWWLPPMQRREATKVLAARSKEPAPIITPFKAVVSEAPRTDADGSSPAADETTTDPVVMDSAVPRSSPPEGAVGARPELMRRYGLMPTAPTPAPVAAAPGPGVSLAMNSGPTPPSGSLEDAAGASAGGMSPSLRARYGLGPRNATPESPVTRVGRSSSSGTALSLARSDPVAASGTPLHDAYRRGMVSPEWAGVIRRDEAVAAGSNPGYVDAGDNPFLSPLTQPLSTFGLDVDTGSYANVRRFLNAGTFPPRAAVRVEEMINYFPYRHAEPTGDEVFGVRTDVAMCPWEPKHRLVRIALKARAVTGERPVANLVFLVDVSGSMQPSERLPLLKEALRALAKRLAASDRVAIVTYASSAGVHLPSTSAEERDKILEAIDSLASGGSTNGEGGIRQAYEVARRHFIPGGVNRVLLCTDGDFNVGMSDQNALVGLIESEAKSGVFLTTLGVGTDNFKDALMRQLADRGNGSYHYLDSHEEAQRVLLEQRDATFITVARDAKAQVEFNPGNVAAWRLIGYEKRLMPAQDFNDDTKDAGDVGAGQTVTVLYEVVPVGVQAPGSVDPLKYQPAVAEESPKRVFARTSELLTLKLRYQRPEGSKSVLKEIAVADREREMEGDFKFAAAVAAFGMALREPSWNGGRGFDTALNLAQQGIGEDPGGWRSEFLTLVRKARGMRR